MRDPILARLVVYVVVIVVALLIASALLDLWAENIKQITP